MTLRGKLFFPLAACAAVAAILIARGGGDGSERPVRTPEPEAAGTALASADTTFSAAAAREAAPREPPKPRSGHERVEERERMVLRQIESPGWTRDPVTDPAVLRAMRDVPRHAFVPPEVRKQAYDDTPLPIGHGQTISQPYIVAVMTQLLRLAPGMKVLEIGTGSGYQAAVLADITSEVYTIEIIEPLAARAAETLADEGYTDVRARNGDGYFGWPEAAPFDAIIVTCAAGHLPPPLWDQLKPGGRIVIPIGGTFSVQRLVVVEKTPDGKRKTNSVMDVRFVPMTGRASEG
jgi:protein-L-isoaspartate(D-aspartate) O-methyltransferase